MSITQERPAVRVPLKARRPAAVTPRHHPHVPAPWVRLEEHVVAGIALGVAGLFMFNIICGPFAIALGVRGYRRGADRTAAGVSVLLGVADLVILAVLIATKFHGGSWVWQVDG